MITFTHVTCACIRVMQWHEKWDINMPMAEYDKTFKWPILHQPPRSISTKEGIIIMTGILGDMF